QKRVKDKNKEERFMKEVKKRMQNVQYEEFIKLLKQTLSEAKPHWNVNRNDQNHPVPKRTTFHQKSMLFAGSVVFYIDLKPRESASYQIVGPDITKFMQQQTQMESKKK
ncbi:MAG: hypothetical protein ACTSP5_13015, partial [Candidatus Heimdallarchaeota archaeon]